VSKKALLISTGEEDFEAPEVVEEEESKAVAEGADGKGYWC
jgi:hypothetical protein